MLGSPTLDLQQEYTQKKQNIYHLNIAQDWHQEYSLLTAYSARGQLMCHEVCIIRCTYVPDSIGSTWAFDAPAQFL